MADLILDLYCGAGGMGQGLRQAGFEIIGVDIEHQARYPGDFIEADALDFLRDLLADEGPWSVSHFAAVHASPPCQASTRLRTRWPGRSWPELIAPTRELMIEVGLPYVIENVEGAKLLDPVILCGSMFGLAVRRHRLFETSFALQAPRCRHAEQGRVVGVYGHTGSGADRGRAKGEGRRNDVAEWRDAMGIDWMTRDELAQAIPPAYGEHVGHALRASL